MQSGANGRGVDNRASTGNYYLYRVNNDGTHTYLRTCGCERAARHWVEQLKARGIVATYSPTTISGAYY